MRLILTTSFLVFSFTPHAVACSCVAPPPPCQAIGQVELVFVGTVTQLRTGDHGFKTATMHVDHAYKGKLNEQEELYDTGMCDGPTLEPGRKYLMYTRRDGGGAIPSRGCTRSRPFETADEDLAFLKHYSTGRVSTYVSGTVRFVPDPDLNEEDRTPLKGVRIHLTNRDKQFQAITDSLGRYSIAGVAPGTYSIAALLAGYSVDWSEEKVSVQPQGCAVSDFLMKIDRRVQGLLRDARGTPTPGALVEMVPVRTDISLLERPILLSETDEQGRYSIEGIPPGEYFLGTNVVSTPTKYHPFQRFYYPGVSHSKDAIKIAIGKAPVTRDYDLQVPGKLPLIEIQGQILNADGSPPLPEDHPHIRFREPGLQGQIEQETIVVDAHGRFRFELCEGIAYSAFAFAGRTRTQVYSSPLEFVASKENQNLKFVLDTSSADFQKLRRHK